MALALWHTGTTGHAPVIWHVGVPVFTGENGMGAWDDKEHLQERDIPRGITVARLKLTALELVDCR